jgi:hypothetical protein
METLTIINSVAIVLIFVHLATKIFSRLTFEIERTFWQNIPYGFYVILWKYPRPCYGGNSGKSVFKIHWRNPDKIKDERK